MHHEQMIPLVLNKENRLHLRPFHYHLTQKAHAYHGGINLNQSYKPDLLMKLKTVYFFFFTCQHIPMVYEQDISGTFGRQCAFLAFVVNTEFIDGNSKPW